MTGKDRFALIAVWAIRLLLAGIFLAAGVSKVLDPIRFTNVVRDFELVHDPWAAWLAMGLPWLEIFTAIAILTPWFALGGTLLAGGMLTVFIGALASAWARGMAIDCGCFGGGGDLLHSYMDVISLRVLLLVLCGLVFWLLWQDAKRQQASG